MHKLALILAFFLIAGIAVVALAENELRLTMNAQNNSGQTGTVTFSVQGNQVKVDIDITPGPAGVAQPAHIHSGTCAEIGGVEYPLTAVMNGKSSTVVDVALSRLQPGPYAVNVHKSPQEAGVYVSCANIPAGSVQTAVAGATATGAPAAAGSPTAAPAAGATMTPGPTATPRLIAAPVSPTATPVAGLPKTGQPNVPLLVGGGVVVVLLLIGSGYAFRRFGV